MNLFFPDPFESEECAASLEFNQLSGVREMKKDAKRKLAHEFHEQWENSFQQSNNFKHVDVVQMDSLEKLEKYADKYPCLSARKLFAIYRIKISELCSKVNKVGF